MKKATLSAIAVAAAFLAAPVTQAHADPVPGWYVDGGGILNETTTANAHYNPGQSTVEYNTGWGLEGGGGYAFDNGFRLEGEVGYINAPVHQVNPVINSHGATINTDITGNLFYDFHTGTLLTPYIGGGMGLDLINSSNIGTYTDGASTNNDQIVFVWQAIAGLAAQLDKNWAITADYRFIDTTDPRYEASSGHAVTMDNASHNIVVGVRYSFGKPPAPAPVEAKAPAVPAYTAAKPAVAPVPQSYMVFFDFNRYTLTPEAERILASAAQDYKKGSYVRIVVTGHTDTVGSAQYNQKLSERRAEAVKAELVRLGLPADQVEASGAGKNGLLVPTANGVREAQNRRAEIVFNKQ